MTQRNHNGSDPLPETSIDEKVTYLYVPFEEKELVKKLGARWDREGRAWFVPPGVSMAPFARWRHAPPAIERPPYVDLHTAERDNDNLLYCVRECASMEVVLFLYECWHCHKPAPAFYGLADHGSFLIIDILYGPEIIDEITAFRKQKELVPLGTVKPRYSKTLNRWTVSQGCPRCDSLFGALFLHREATDHALNLPDDYPYRFALEQWPPASVLDYVRDHEL